MIEKKHSGYVFLYDREALCVAAKGYTTLRNRQEIIDEWIKLYRLQDKIYILGIRPND